MHGWPGGSYTVQLSLLTEWGEAIAFESPATLSEAPGGVCLGDLDYNGHVGLSDLSILLAAYALDGGGDLNTDGDTDIVDLALMLGNWDIVCP